jgi:multiple sugar transport system permease protein
MSTESLVRGEFISRSAAAETRLARSGVWQRRTRHGLRYLILTLVALTTLIPFVAMVLLAITPPGGLALPSLVPKSLTLANIQQTLANDGLVRWTLNSLIYSIVSIVLALLLASLAGYAFAKKKFAGRDVMFWSFVAMLMVPGQITIVPLFLLVAEMGGINTYWGLIVPTLANAQAVFLLRQFIRDLPDELIEAAKLDGASEFHIYARIIMPLTYPVLATLGIFIFLSHWNDFFWPLLVGQSDSMRTLTVGLSTLQARHPATGIIMAAATINFIPCFIVFVALQRYLVKGISMTGIK